MSWKLIRDEDGKIGKEQFMEIKRRDLEFYPKVIAKSLKDPKPEFLNVLI